MTLETSRRTTQGIHAFDTEARSLEQACDLISERIRGAKIQRARKGSKQTLRQEFSSAKLHAMNLKRFGKITLAGGSNNPQIKRKIKTPHPFKDLSDDKKCIRARELYESGSWGIGSSACKRLALAFGVTVGQISEWVV